MNKYNLPGRLHLQGRLMVSRKQKRLRLGRYYVRLIFEPSWRSKPYPFWFARRYKQSVGGTVQIMFLELHWRKERQGEFDR